MMVTQRLRYLLFLILPVVMNAQITHRNLLQRTWPASRLEQVLISQSTFRPFPKTPAAWKQILPDSILQQLVRNGENGLKESFPNIPASITLDFIRNGNRSRYEDISFGKRNRLWNLVLAESVEGKKRFMDAIVNGIWSICEESFWGSSAHLFIQKSGAGLPDVEHPVVDLFAAETAANLALADYFIGPGLDSISPLIRQRIYYEVNRRIFVPLQSATYDWLGKGDTNAKLNNWAPWIMSNYLVAVLFLEKDSRKRVEYTSRALQITDQYINGIGDDGGCEEGPHYWSFGPACVLDILDLLGRASNGQIDVSHENIIRNMGAYIYRTHIAGNYFVNIGDSHPQENPEPVMVWRFGKVVTDTSLSSFGAWLFRTAGFTINQSFHRSRELFDLMNMKTIAGDMQVFHEKKRVWLPDVQLMATRLPGGLFVAAHGGNNGESHNHNDVGDFIIYVDSDPVIIDVGSGTYTAKTFSKHRYDLWFNSSAYHNLPTINGQQQEEGAKYAAGRVSYTSDEEQTSLVMDIEKAYPAKAGLVTWKRAIASNDKKISVVDSFTSLKSLTSLTQSVMTVCKVDIDHPGIIIFTTQHGYTVSLTYGSEWHAAKETMPLTTEEDQGLKATWHDNSITRILLTNYSPTRAGRFEYTITKEK